MILARNVFQLKFGRAREATPLVKEDEALAKRHGNNPTHYLTDLSGPFYTLVMKMTFESLAALEKSQSGMIGSKEFSDWYQKFVPLVDSGHREIYSILS